MYDDDDDERHQIAAAANILLKHPEAPELFKMLTDVLALPDRLKVRLSEDAAVLNPLLYVARQDRSRFDRLIAVVEDKRASLGRPPLRPDADDAPFDKNKYQRELMASIRVRTFKAAATENLRRPPSGQLIGAARLDFMKVQRKKWMARLDPMLAAARAGGTMTKEQRQAISGKFWDQVDAELEADEAAVHNWIQSGRRGPAP